MSWSWEFIKSDGTKHADLPMEFAQDNSFHSQADAETWIGEVFEDLLDVEVEEVNLMEDGKLIYGPMGLHPSD